MSEIRTGVGLVRQVDLRQRTGRLETLLGDRPFNFSESLEGSIIKAFCEQRECRLIGDPVEGRLYVTRVEWVAC